MGLSYDNVPRIIDQDQDIGRLCAWKRVASGKSICAKVRSPERMQDIDDVVVYFLHTNEALKGQMCPYRHVYGTCVGRDSGLVERSEDIYVM
jgi:hypothetical protein